MKQDVAAVHVWLGGIQRTGGIQAYSRDLLRALGTYRPDLDVEVLLKNDRAPWDETIDSAELRLHGTGGIPEPVRTPVFAVTALGRAAIRRPGLIVAGHVHFAPLASWARRIAGSPYWAVVYGIEAWGDEARVSPQALLDASLIISISRYTADRLIEDYGLDRSRVSILPCTFDPERFRPAPKPVALLDRYALGSGQPVVLTVARLAGLDRYKGYDAVLDALPRIRAAIPDVRYVVVGDGPDRNRVVDRIRRQGLEDAVTLAGAVPDGELVDHYNLCDVFAMPSRGEGFGIVFLEALGCGKPVIGGTEGGARDPLMDGELGALVDPNDERGLAETIVRILRGETVEGRLHRPAELRQRVVEEFGPDRFRERLGRIVAKEMKA